LIIWGIGRSPIEKKLKMSLYDELSVFKARYDLLLNFFHFTSNFKREYKYTVVDKLKNEMLALIVLVYRAKEEYVIRKNK
jgi:hypothetical protein